MGMKLETFNERLFWARRYYARMTQQQVRDVMEEQYGVNIGRNYISQMETDPTTQPTLKVLSALAGALHVSLDYLAGFTNEPAPGHSDEPTPNYISPEADEIARIVDTMHPSQREILLSVAKNMLAAPTRRQQERAEIRDILDSIERQYGRSVRVEVENLMRSKGMPVDPTT